MCVCIFESPPNNPALTKFKEKKEKYKLLWKKFRFSLSLSPITLLFVTDFFVKVEFQVLSYLLSSCFIVGFFILIDVFFSFRRIERDGFLFLYMAM